MASVNWPHSKEWKVALNNIAMEFKYFKRNSACLQHYLMNSAHLLIVKACLVSLLFNCAHYSALQFFAKWISCMNSPTCCSQIFFVISTASPFVLTRKAKNGYFLSTTLYRSPFSYTTCIKSCALQPTISPWKKLHSTWNLLNVCRRPAAT